MKILKNKKLDCIRELLRPHTSRAYLVGGCVRDIFLGIKSVDYDIEVYDIDADKFHDIMQAIGANCVGKSFFIYKYKDFDIGLARVENKIGQRHQDFEVKYCDNEQTASLRRDFTINSIMLNIFNGDIVDCHDGISDIKNLVLRHIDSDKFCEDSLRVLRGVQFASRFNLKIENSTLSLMKDQSIDNLSLDRICTELIKFFNADNLCIGSYYLYELGYFERFFSLTIDNNKFLQFNKFLFKKSKIFQDERTFLYLLCGFFSLDISKIVLRLKLPKRFLTIQKEPFYLNFFTKFDLVFIATKMPLKYWLGLNDNVRISMSKKLNLYEKKLDFFIDTNVILKQGYKGAQIGYQIDALIKKEVCKFLNLNETSKIFNVNIDTIT